MIQKEEAAKPQGDQGEKNQFLGQMEDCGQRAEYHNLVDILFVIDATGSMSWCISQMKKTVCKIMKKFSDKQYNIKFAIELYRDHPPQQYSYVEKHFDLRNLDDTIQVIDNECDVAGGGDSPQAVFDGLVNGLKKTKWRVSTDGKTKSKRFLFHGCDAPPHGTEYGGNSSDKNWREKGCPCGLTRHNVKQLLDEYNVDYSLIKCGTQTDRMATLFKECFGTKFKRELAIEKGKGKSGKRGSGRRGGSGLERKLSCEYMEQIQREQAYGDESEQEQREYLQKSCKQSSFECFDLADKPRVRRSSIKRVVKKQVKKQKSGEKKKKQYSGSGSSSGSDSSDEQKGGKARSMASLVLSDIEDGIEDYFEEGKKKEGKEEKAEKEKETKNQEKVQKEAQI